VVTNVVPYIISLSALLFMMQAAGVTGGKYQASAVIALVGMLYSIYAIYASGKDAVMGGTLVLALGYVMWGYLAPRFRAKTSSTASEPVANVTEYAAVAPAE
jgi:putrescine:ornithine antiporter